MSSAFVNFLKKMSGYRCLGVAGVTPSKRSLIRSICALLSSWCWPILVHDAPFLNVSLLDGLITKPIIIWPDQVLHAVPHYPDKLPSAAKDTEKTKIDLKDMKCFNCQQKGHLAASCPHGAMFCNEYRVDYKGNSAVQQAPVAHTQGLCVPGKVEGTPVQLY